MECRHCGGNKFRRVPRTAFLQEAVSRLGFAAWQCRDCQKVCVVRHHGLAMVADESSVLAMLGAMDGTLAHTTAQPNAMSNEIKFTTVSPSHGYMAPRPVPVP